jgi:hypothetical protein
VFGVAVVFESRGGGVEEVCEWSEDEGTREDDGNGGLRL